MWGFPRLVTCVAAVAGCGPAGDAAGPTDVKQLAPALSKVAVTDDCPRPPPKPYRDSLAHLGRGYGDNFIEIIDVVADEPLVFSCTGTQGLTIWDTTNVNMPDLVVENVGPEGLVHEKYPRCQHVSLDRAARTVAITNRGDEIQKTPYLAMYDVHKPSSPELLAKWAGKMPIEGVLLEGNRIYAAAHAEGLVVFERRGRRLRVVGAHSDLRSNAWQVARAGSHLVVAEAQHGLRVYALRGTRPRPVASVKLRGSSKDVVVDGKIAYVATSFGLAIVDLTRPARPKLLREVPTPGTAVGVARGQPGVVFVADWGELRAFDVRDPLHARQIATEIVPTEGEFSRVLAVDATDKGRVYAGEWEGMRVFDHDLHARAPELEVIPGEFQFGNPGIGQADERVLTVRNDGEEPMVVTGVESSHSTVKVNPFCFEVLPGQAREVDISYRPNSDRPLTGEITLLTNDPDETVTKVPISGNRGGLDVGKPAPKIDLVDLSGGRWNSDFLGGKVLLLAYFATF